MKTTRKTLLSIAVVSALIVAAVGALEARGFGPGGGPGWGGHPGMMRGPAAFDPAQLEQQKTGLGITAQQESAWNNYVAAIQAKSELMLSHRQTRFSGTVTPDQMLSLREEGLAQMQKVNAATRDLYTVLTPEQKTQFAGAVGPRCRRW